MAVRVTAVLVIRALTAHGSEMRQP